MKKTIKYGLLLAICFGTISAQDIHMAAGAGDLALVQQILDAAPGRINEKDEFQRTPMHYAATAGRDNVVRELIRRGARANLQDAVLNTPLHNAALENQVAVVDILIRQGHSRSLDIRNRHGFTPYQVGTPGSRAVIDRYTQELREAG